MFTTPDNDDAVPDCPPFNPPGPVPSGFYKDCQTIPTAEHFNELIVNLRGLLYQTTIVDEGDGVVAVKGDSTTLAQGVLRAGVITQGILVDVDPAGGGVAEPRDPFAGDPFDKLSSALKWAKRFRMAGPHGFLTINLAGAQTHNEPNEVMVDHPDGHRLDIRGADKTGTVLNFLGSRGGLWVRGPLHGLFNFTICGNNQSSAGPGLWVDGGRIGHLDELELTAWNYPQAAVVLDGGFVRCAKPWPEIPTNGTLKIYNCHAGGIWLSGGSTFYADTLTVQQIGRVYELPFWYGLLVQHGSRAMIDTCTIDTAAVGIRVTGAGSYLGARILHANNSDAPAAITADNMGSIQNTNTAATPGDWSTWNTAANTPQNFAASAMSLINAQHALATANVANASPAVNVTGNNGSLIIST